MTSEMQGGALFGSSRDALLFALTYSRPDVKAPTMNSLLTQSEPAADWMSAPTRRHCDVTLPKGSDAILQAGAILLHYAKLQPHHRLMTMCRVASPRIRCECHSPCCCGWSPNPEWEAAVDAICLVLRDYAKLKQGSGKRGMSSQPLLRRAVVERHYDPKRRWSPKELAIQCEISEMTVYHHRTIFGEWLEDQEKQAWTLLDELLVGAGIVGAIS